MSLSKGAEIRKQMQKARKLRSLPIPQKPVCLTQEDDGWLVFEEEDEWGRRTDVPVTNFYISIEDHPSTIWG